MADVLQIEAWYDMQENEKPVTIPWLSNMHEDDEDSARTPRVPSDKGIFTMLKETQPHKSLWSLVQYAMPSFLVKKYHIVDVSMLRRPIYTNALYITTATSFVMWNEVLGITQLSSINKTHEKFYELKREHKSIEQWSENLKQYFKYLKMAQGKIPKAPTDLCTKASEFLLEPCIHIQLPWKPVLLHQWLTAALAEVMIIERDSVEFRHWPIPKEMLTLVNTFLTVILTLKKIILLGFVILSEQVNNEVYNNPKHPNMIKDKVVFPSGYALQFIVNGKAKEMLNCMKICAFSKSEKIENSDSFTYSSPKSFCLNSFFTQFNDEFFYNSLIWRVNEFETRKLIPSLQRYEEVCETVDFQNIDEECEVRALAMVMPTSKSSLTNMDMNEMVTLSLKTIKEKVIDEGKLPQLSLPDVEKILRTSIPDVFTDHPSIKFRNSIVLICLKYHDTYTLLLDCEKEKSVVSQIITLRLKFLERYCISKLTALISIEFKITPIAKTLECPNPKSIDTMMTELLVIQGRMDADFTNYVLAPLWYEECCKEEVSQTEEVPTSIERGEIVIEFQNRIKRLVYNIALNAFSVPIERVKSFSDWTTVQYLLPCLVGSYLDQCQNRGFHLHYIKFVHEVIKYYEIKYLTWEMALQRPVRMIIPPVEAADLTYHEWRQLNYKVVNNLRLILGIKTLNDSFSSRIIGIDELIDGIHDWPTIVTYLTDVTLFPEFQIILNKWWKFAFKFTENLFRICIKLYEIPNPGSVITTCPILGQLYQTSAILSELEIFYYSSEQFSRKVSLESVKLVDDSIALMNQNRFQILKAVLDAHSLSQEFLNKFVKFHKLNQITLYTKLKIYRQQHKTEEFNSSLADLLPLSRVYPNLKPAVTHYINGDFEALEKMLTLFAPLNAQPENPVDLSYLSDMNGPHYLFMQLGDNFGV